MSTPIYRDTNVLMVAYDRKQVKDHRTFDFEGQRQYTDAYCLTPLSRPSGMKNPLYWYLEILLPLHMKLADCRVELDRGNIGRVGMWTSHQMRSWTSRGGGVVWQTMLLPFILCVQVHDFALNVFCSFFVISVIEQEFFTCIVCGLHSLLDVSKKGPPTHCNSSRY